MWKEGAHSNDYKFFDNRISEMYTVGGTGISVHKYLGVLDQSGAGDNSGDDPLAIQDLLFLENRDRKYDQDIYNLRGIYNVADVDFDLSQFGLFLQNDTIFITFHLNDMIDSLGRRLASGDVLELPHLRDYDGLDTSLDQALKRYYVVQEGSRPSEGYSPTWWPHLWRVKCTPLVDSQEYQDILKTIQIDESTGESTGATLRDLLSTYQKELEVTNAIVTEAEKNVPKSGYDTSQFYTVPTKSDGRPGEPVGHRADETSFTTDSDIITADNTVQTPRAQGYKGYLLGDSLAPNGHPVTSGTQFPTTAVEGDYVLRLDFLPNRLFRYDGRRWVKMEDSVRSNVTNGTGNTQRDSFINNATQTTMDDNSVVSERQALSKILTAQEDD
jgi:hypothetical protein